MEKKEIYGLLDQMCEEIAILEKSRKANIGNQFIKNLATLTEEPDILEIIVDRMDKEEVPYLDEVLCNFTNINELSLTEKQIIKLSKIPAKSPVYSEDEVIGCILSSVSNKLTKPTIKKIAKSLERNVDDFFRDYLDLLWDNIFKANITEEEKDKARRIYEETKDWFFDEGWL